MNNLIADELREMYQSFFESKGHARISGASVIPENDPTVLFTTAGMHPLVPYLMGQMPHPAGTRLTDVQKCVRTGDIDEVGDAAHLTFFEMLGNWSLNDYFKKEAISWSFEFLTTKLGFKPEQLNVTVFRGEGKEGDEGYIPADEEAVEIWKSGGIPEERIFRLPREDNWWGPAGTTGPCGPDTEMFIDTGKPKCGPDCRPGCHCGKYIEIWNDVFMQYNKNEEGKFVPLGRHNVDTGMGVERTICMMSGAPTVYDTEIFAPIMAKIDELRELGSNSVSRVSNSVAGVSNDSNRVSKDPKDSKDAKDSKDSKGHKDALVPGMVYSTLSFAGEMKAKESQLRDFFDRARLKVEDFRSPPSTSTSFLNYRNKAVYHFAKQRGRWAIGYRTEPTHEIVDVESDPLARPEINAKLPEIRRSVLTLLTTGPEAVRRDIERKGNVTVRWTAKSGVKWWVGEPPAGLVLKETTCGRDFEVPADGFYQVNPEVGEELVKAVVAEYQKGADVAPDVLDLYCGVGVFGLCCNPPKLTGIESGRQAIDFAKRNAAAQKFSNARFYAEQVGRNLKRISINAHTTVIVDPPRDGMEPNVPKWLADSKAPRILYVSCDPATLMRDLKTICRTYDVESVRWFNMFPRTARFETLVVLKKRV